MKEQIKKLEYTLKEMQETYYKKANKVIIDYYNDYGCTVRSVQYSRDGKQWRYGELFSGSFGFLPSCTTRKLNSEVRKILLKHSGKVSVLYYA